MKKVFELEVTEIEKDDRGLAKIAHCENEGEVFFRIQSWRDNDDKHPEFDALQLREGSKIRITLEVDQ
jgi:hypothetical protein